MKPLASAIIISIILLCWFPLIKNAYATDVSGTIATPTEWTINQSPINLNGTITIDDTGTLTIDPGVTVNFGDGNLIVQGNLQAIGEANNQITFNPSKGFIPIVRFEGGLELNIVVVGSVLENVVFNVGLQLSSAPVKIDDCTFNSEFEGVLVNGGDPVISSCRFEAQTSEGIYVESGAPQITGNEFDLISAGIITVSTSSFNVTGNTFLSCGFGIQVPPGGQGILVNGNSFRNCQDGIDVDVASVSMTTIENNLIDNSSRYGISGGGLIYNNTISNNAIGVHNPFLGSAISGNNIVGNSQHSVTAETSGINAQNNWWGTTDIPTINQTIYDKKIDTTLGTIFFVPFLTSPNLLAPAIPGSTPALTPIPTAEPTPSPTPTPSQTQMTPSPTATNQKLTSLNNIIQHLLDLNLITTLAAAVTAVVLITVIYLAQKQHTKKASKLGKNGLNTLNSIDVKFAIHLELH